MKNSNLTEMEHGDIATSDDLFSNIFTAASEPVLPPLRCQVCGEAFESSRLRGRPRAACSDACRSAAAAAQRRAWLLDHGEGRANRTAIACQTCGTSFAAQSVKAGRMPRFCSEGCRHARILSNKAKNRAKRHAREGAVKSPEG